MKNLERVYVCMCVRVARACVCASVRACVCVRLSSLSKFSRSGVENLQKSLCVCV